MLLREILRKMVEGVGGGVGAVVMGYDGIAIDQFLIDDPTVDVQLLAVEYATVLKEIRKTVDVLNNGSMEEVSINTDHTRVLLRVMDEDLFVIFVLLHDGNYGKARYLLKRETPKMREFLS